jgi:hypothetical protein
MLRLKYATCHSRESGNPGPDDVRFPWVPAFAGTTGQAVIPAKASRR